MGSVRVVQVGMGHPHARALRETLAQMPEVEHAGAGEADDFGELLRSVRPDVAVITLPADLAPEAMVRAAEAGVHFYADKPGARTARDLLPAVEAVRRAGVVTTHGYLRRSMPAGQAIKRIVDEGLLGRLISVEARWVTTSVARRGPTSFYFDRARSGGGMLNWLGCHYVDFMRWATSAEVVEVAAIAATLSGEPIDVEDVATLALRYDNGMVGSLHCAYTTDRDTDQAFALRGTLGWLRWDGAGPTVEVRSTHPSWLGAPNRVLRFEADPVPGYTGAVGVAALRHFLAATRGDVAPVDTIEDALRVLETLDAAQEAIRTGRNVKPQQARAG